MAETTPLPRSENPWAWMKYVGSHEYVNQAVQLVTNVVKRSAQIGGCRRNVAHGTRSAASRASTGSGVPRDHADHETSQTRPIAA